MTEKPLKIFAPAGGEPDPGALAQMQTVMLDERAAAGVLCADHHLGYSMPIGGVVAYEGAISPTGVGVDIACGNKAVRTKLLASELRPELPRIMDEINDRIAFGMGRGRVAGSVEPDDSLFDRHADLLAELDRLAWRGKTALSQRARAQLGTVGGGNHYVDLLVDEEEHVWVACHFGSRGLGHTICSGFVNLAHDQPFNHTGKVPDDAVVFDVDTEIGAHYIAAMELAGEYAYAGRDYVVAQVLDLLGVESQLKVHNHHNYAWLEHGRWVVRKGSTPLTGAPAFIGGSMLEGAAIVRRRRAAKANDLGSAPHGAGRAMSRTKAAGKRKRSTRYSCPDRECDYWITPQRFDSIMAAAKKNPPLVPGVFCPHHPDKQLRRHRHFQQVSGGLIDWEATQRHLQDEGIELRGGAADEAPGVYKSLRDVLAAHDNVEVLSWLRPLGVIMAPPDVMPDD